jgi:hypothetical protein
MLRIKLARAGGYGQSPRMLGSFGRLQIPIGLGTDVGIAGRHISLRKVPSFIPTVLSV